MITQRNSNIELLRIISILMVLLLHFNNHGYYPGLVLFPDPLTAHLKTGFLIECFCIVAVNCFVLISGYFGINLKLRSVLKLFLQCFFIGLFSYLLYLCITHRAVDSEVIGDLFYAFSHNKWWFVISYLGLMLVSPLLNAAVQTVSRKQLLISILVFTAFLGYFGWYHDMEHTDSGYSLISLILIYLIGRYIGLYVSLDWIKRHRWCFAVGYVVGSLLLFGLILLRYGGNEINNIFGYDHPLVIINACLLLLFFLSLQFHSRVVNWIASSVFASYLIHESIYFGDQLLYPWSSEYFASLTSHSELWLLALALGFLLLSVLIDKILALLSRPLLLLYDKLYRLICSA